MTRRAPNPHYPDEQLRRAEKLLSAARKALGDARDALSDALGPEFTAMGGPDRAKLEAARDNTSRMRGDLEVALGGLDHIRSTGGCGVDSDAAKRSRSVFRST